MDGYKHGLTSNGKRPPTEYNIWATMKQRCHNKKASGYRYYGGRGIKVCRRWRASFLAFLADMGSRPDGCTLDRIDVNGNYEAANCRWADDRTQALNRRRKGLSATLPPDISVADIAKMHGVSRQRIDRKFRDGWTAAEIIANQRAPKPGN